MAVTATVRAEITGQQTKVADQGTATFPYAAALTQGFTDGAGVGQANVIFSDTRTLAPSGTENLDVAGVLLDVYGATATFARIKAVMVKAAAANTNQVQVTRPGATGVPLFMAAGDGIALDPGAAFLWVTPTATGVATAAGTADLLTITNSAGGTSVTYDIVILGAAT